MSRSSEPDRRVLPSASEALTVLTQPWCPVQDVLHLQARDESLRPTEPKKKAEPRVKRTTALGRGIYYKTKQGWRLHPRSRGGRGMIRLCHCRESSGTASFLVSSRRVSGETEKRLLQAT